MNSEHKVKATKYVWATFFFALLISNASSVFYGQTPVIENVIMTVVVAIAACGASVAISTSENPFSSNEQDSENKLKRGERVKRLIDLMDDDELYELRQRLSKEYHAPPDDYVMLSDDGELIREKVK